MTDVLRRAFSGYLTDIRSSGSDIRWISESEGLPMRKPCGEQATHQSLAGLRSASVGAKRVPLARSTPRRGPTLNIVKYEGTYLSS